MGELTTKMIRISRTLSLAGALFLSACSPAPETDVSPPAPPISGSSSPNLEDQFRRIHGSAYDPNSRLDREKMTALQGKEKPSEVSVSDRGPEGVPPATVKDSLTVRNSIIAVARPLIGQTETHGSNRSPIIDKMNKLTGVPMGSPYCASFNAWVYAEAGAPGSWPKSAWSPDWVKNPTWTAAKGGKEPLPGDAFGIWFSSKGRIAHTGIIESWGKTSSITIEGNTSPSAEFGSSSDRDGDGIWRKRRFNYQIHSARDWIDNNK